MLKEWRAKRAQKRIRDAVDILAGPGFVPTAEEHEAYRVANEAAESLKTVPARCRRCGVPLLILVTDLENEWNGLCSTCDAQTAEYPFVIENEDRINFDRDMASGDAFGAEVDPHETIEQ